jgi:GT2 family glycosyltransferase
MIGIGITTYNRYNILNLCLEQIAKHTKQQHKIFIWDDTLEQKGISYGKNQCINALYEQGCSHIFLFDDDCFPISNNWHTMFVESPFKHLIYANKKEHNFLGNINIKNNNLISAKYYEGSAGCFIYITRSIVDKIGYFNTKYHKYGYEHAGYSTRVFKAGITSHNFICLNQTESYIHSLDLDGSFNGYENSITLEKDYKNYCISQNKEIYLQEINSNKLYYPFNQ